MDVATNTPPLPTNPVPPAALPPGRPNLGKYLVLLVAGVFLVATALLIGISLYQSALLAKPVPIQQSQANKGLNSSITFTTTENPTGSPSANPGTVDTSTTQLNKDAQALDTNLNSLNSDLNGINQSLNDQSVDLTTP